MTFNKVPNFVLNAITYMSNLLGSATLMFGAINSTCRGHLLWRSTKNEMNISLKTSRGLLFFIRDLSLMRKKKTTPS